MHAFLSSVSRLLRLLNSWYERNERRKIKKRGRASKNASFTYIIKHHGCAVRWLVPFFVKDEILLHLPQRALCTLILSYCSIGIPKIISRSYDLITRHTTSVDSAAILLFNYVRKSEQAIGVWSINIFFVWCLNLWGFKDESSLIEHIFISFYEPHIYFYYFLHLYTSRILNPWWNISH